MFKKLSNGHKIIWTITFLGRRKGFDKKGFIKVPTSKKEWLDTATEFDNKWNFPHCLGAIDGKHIIIQAPPRSGSTFLNHKKLFSIVLLAVCNTNYEFTLVDIGETVN